MCRRCLLMRKVYSEQKTQPKDHKAHHAKTQGKMKSGQAAGQNVTENTSP